MLKWGGGEVGRRYVVGDERRWEDRDEVVQVVTLRCVAKIEAPELRKGALKAKGQYVHFFVCKPRVILGRGTINYAQRTRGKKITD